MISRFPTNLSLRHQITAVSLPSCRKPSLPERSEPPEVRTTSPTIPPGLLPLGFFCFLGRGSPKPLLIKQIPVLTDPGFLTAGMHTASRCSQCTCSAGGKRGFLCRLSSPPRPRVCCHRWGLRLGTSCFITEGVWATNEAGVRTRASPLPGNHCTLPVRAPPDGVCPRAQESPDGPLSVPRLLVHPSSAPEAQLCFFFHFPLHHLAHSFIHTGLQCRCRSDF